MKEQYFIYDENALIADIGGYLGLLLGHSILSIFQTLVAGILRAANSLRLSKKRKTFD